MVKSSDEQGSDKSLAGKAAMAVGSAAIAAALLWVRGRRGQRTPKSPPPHPEKAPETD